MDEWPLQPLGRHADVRARIGWRGLSAEEYADDGPYLIAGKHIVNGEIAWNSCDHLTQWRYDESPEIALRDHDVVISKDGTIGRVARIDALPGPATLNGTMMLVRPHPSLDYRFLAHVLGGHAFQKLIADRTSGSSIPHLFQRDIVGLHVRLPPLEEQRQIAEILDTIDETIQATERVIAKLQSSHIGLEQHLIASVDGMGVPLQSIALVERGKFSARPRNDPSFFGGAHPFIQTGDVTRARRGRGVGCSQSLNSLGLSVSRSFPPGTVAVTIAANIADTAILTREMCFPDSVVGVVVDAPNDTRWVEMCIHAGKPMLEARAPQSAQKNINLQDLRPLRIPLPSPDQQRELASAWEAQTERIHSERLALEKLHGTRSGLAADLLSGRVRAVAV